MALYDYDLIVVGSGAGGSVAAHLLNKAGLSVAVIESGLVGGSCPNVAEVPMKALLQAAEIYEAAKHGGRFGIRGGTVGYNYPSIKSWKDLAVRRTGTHIGAEMFTDEGINLVRGSAYFIDPHTITVGTARFSAKYFLVATGSELVLPSIPGLANGGFLTPHEAINLTRPPRRLAIIGGDTIGCEFTQLFATFGTKIYLIDAAPQLLSDEEPEASTLLAERFEDQYSVTLRLNTTVEQVEKIGATRRLTLQTGKKRQTIIVDDILLATEKKPAIDIGLENAGVEYDEGRILTNYYMQTSSPHIFAAGDCTGPFALTHVSTYQSRIVAHNVLHLKKRVMVDYRAVPRCTFTNPTVASVGQSETELKRAGRSYQQAVVPISVVGKANISDVSEGFVKVLSSADTGILIGATIVSPGADEMIHELAVAIQNSLTAQAVANTIHVFPTWSEAIRVACAKLAKL